MTPSLVSDETAEAVSAVAKTFQHRLRIELLDALWAAGQGSATTLSKGLGEVSVPHCNYHLHSLEDGGLIKRARSRRVRGSTEHIYRPVPFSQWPDGRHLALFVGTVVRLGFQGCGSTAVPLELDSEGMSAAATVVSDARTTLSRISDESSQRMQSSGEESVIAFVGVVLSRPDRGAD